MRDEQKRIDNNDRRNRRYCTAVRSDETNGFAGNSRSALEKALGATRVSWGWKMTIWLAHIVPQEDHRKVNGARMGRASTDDLRASNAAVDKRDGFHGRLAGTGAEKFE